LNYVRWNKDELAHMQWKKMGLIYKPDNVHPWSVSHAQVPIVDRVNDDVLRIYFGTRDKTNRTVTTYIEVEADNPQHILYVHDKQCLGLGELGCFDDSGAMPSWIVNQGDLKYLYYIGWNTGVTVSYRNSIGLAVSHDQGRTFERMYPGPIMDRTKTEPQFCACPCVIVENGLWRMWYLSCVKWGVYKGHTEPFYHIKYAESHDGIHWDRQGIVAIDFKSDHEAGIVRSSVIKEDGLYRMWYSYRGYKDYRTETTVSYRIGYADSNDGTTWTRKDEQVGLDISNTGWDSEMLAYPYVYRHKGETYMIYNGNGFGRSGIGYARLQSY
ncbi:MAG: hypothetical protein AAF629_35525, partial [Chloroflexota bacterium]